MKKLIILLSLIAVTLSAQTVYRIRMPNRTWQARLIGVTGTGAEGDTLVGTYDLKYNAHEFLLIHTGGYDLEYIPTDGTEWLVDEDWDAGQTDGKFLVGSDLNVGLSHNFTDYLRIYASSTDDADLWLENAKGDSGLVSMENHYYGDLNVPTLYMNAPDSGRIALQGHNGQQGVSYVEVLNDYFGIRPFVTKDSIFTIKSDTTTGESELWFDGITTLDGNINVSGDAAFLDTIHTACVRIASSTGANILYGNSCGENISSGQFNCGFGYKPIKNLTIGSGNTAIGYNSAYNLLSGDNNVAIGIRALYDAKIGNQNVVMGAYSMQRADTSYYNISIGTGASPDFLKGSANIFVGYNTAGGIKTGSYNTIIGSNITGLSSTTNNYIILADGQGHQRMVIDSTGNATFDKNVTADSIKINSINYQNSADYNVFLGYHSGINATGICNTAVGYQALREVTTGHNNIGIGTNSGLGIKTGQYNISIGDLTLTASISDSSNIAIGASALYQLNGGNNNVAIGTGAGNDLIEGKNNIYLGFNSGGDITHGDYNVLIGGNITGLSSTTNNYIILADGQGHQRIVIDSTGNATFDKNVTAEDTLRTHYLLADSITTPTSSLTIIKIDTIKTGSGVVRWLKLYTNGGLIFYAAADTTTY